MTFQDPSFAKPCQTETFAALAQPGWILLFFPLLLLLLQVRTEFDELHHFRAQGTRLLLILAKTLETEATDANLPHNQMSGASISRFTTQVWPCGAGSPVGDEPWILCIVTVS